MLHHHGYTDLNEIWNEDMLILEERHTTITAITDIYAGKS